MNRGLGRQIVFNSNHHRIIFIDLIRECCELYNIKVYAYCLMDNHFHILLSTPDANLPRVMRHLGGVYTQKFRYSLRDIARFVGYMRYESVSAAVRKCQNELNRAPSLGKEVDQIVNRAKSLLLQAS